MRVNPASWNPEGSDRRVELLDEDGEKGKKRGDIPRSFLLRFSSLSSREGDISSSTTHNCLIHEDMGQFKEGKENNIFKRRSFTRLLCISIEIDTIY